jgi:hypothetical protein
MEPNYENLVSNLHSSAVKKLERRNKDKKEVVPEGVEPSTLALLAPHSNQLSYGTRL